MKRKRLIANRLSAVLPVLLLIITCTTAKAQERKLLKGQIQGETSVENIHVINLSLEKGTTTNKNGEFEITAKEGDSIFFSSVQYEKKTVRVSSAIVADNFLQVSLSIAMNELAEVMIDDIKLTGYLAVDIGKISTKNIELKNRLQTGLSDVIQKDRELNPYVPPNGKGNLGLLAGKVLEKMQKPGQEIVDNTPQKLVEKSLQIIGFEFFREDLKLNKNEIYNFLYYCADDKIFQNLVLKNKALSLIEYFQQHISEFKELRGVLLNRQKQIPG